MGVSRLARCALRIPDYIVVFVLLSALILGNDLTTTPPLFFLTVHAWSFSSTTSTSDAGSDRRRALLTRRESLHQSAAALIPSSLVLLLSTPPVSAAGLNSGVPNSYDEISERLSSNNLQQIPASQAFRSGTDNTPYPGWLQGTWKLKQTLVAVETPLGLAYAGGPNGVESIAEKSMAESRSKLGIPVELQVRYVPSNGITVEDRLYNTRQRLDTFAGRSVVAQVEYADTKASNRAAFQAATGRDNDPLETTFIRYKGPAAQKVFVTAHSGLVDESLDSWLGFECQRSLFALTNQSTAPPITTDTELIFSYRKIDNDNIEGKLRIAGYLNPNDKLYFQARNRAVTIQDYTLELRRVQEVA